MDLILILKIIVILKKYSLLLQIKLDALYFIWQPYFQTN